MSQSPPTIIIVDDDPATVAFLCDYLTELGFNPGSCPIGPQTAACIAQAAPRCVILDVDLGAITGVEVFQQVRALVTMHLVPVIFFTGSEGMLRHALPDYHARGAALVVKPNLAGLMARIHTCVQQHA